MLHHRSRVITGVILGIGLPFATFASFMGPTQSPPGGNVPGVVWNRPTTGGSANEQSGADFNLAGSGRLGGDFILGDTKALRIDKAGAATFNIGNWGAGIQPLNVMVYGNLTTNPTGVGLGQSEGKITAPKYCIGIDCITAWPGGGGGSGDITDVLAGVGLTGGGASGAVTLNFDPAYGDGRYVKKLGDTMTGFLTLNADPNSALQAATKQYVDNSVSQAGGGDVTGVSAGTGITVATPNGPVPDVSFDEAYGDGRYVNVNGDVMTGTLELPNFKMSNALLGTVQGYPWQLPADRSLLELKNLSGARLQLMREGNASLINSILPAGPYPANMLFFSRGDGIEASLVNNSAGLRTIESQSPLPGGYGAHTDVSVGYNSGGGGHFGVSASAMTNTSYAGRFQSTYSGTRSATLGGPVNAAEFTGNVCINGDCKSAWPASGAGTVTQVNSGTGLTGGPITGSGTLTLDTAYTDPRYVNATGDNMTGDLTSTGIITTNGTINGGTVGSNTYGFRSDNTGNTYGVYTNAASYGTYGRGGTSGGYFTNSSAAYSTYVAYNGYGIYASVPTVTDFGLYTNGKAQINGDIVASGNTPASCLTEAVAAGAVTYQCTGGKFMAGIRKNASNVVDGVVCCEL